MDIDDTLIRAAWKRRRTIWSQQPNLQGPKNLLDGSESRPTKRSKTSEPEAQDKHRHTSFPAAFEHMFGPLPIPPAEPQTAIVFPHNISFRTTDWVNDGAIEDRGGYNVVLA